MSFDFAFIRSRRQERLRERLSSESDLQLFAKRVWNHVQRDVDRYAIAELVEQQIGTWDLIERLRAALHALSTSSGLPEVGAGLIDVNEEAKQKARESLGAVSEGPEMPVIEKLRGKLASGSEMNSEDLRSRIDGLLDRQSIRSITYRCGIECIGAGLQLPTMSVKSWWPEVKRLVERDEETGRGRLLDLYGRLRDVIRNRDDGGKEFFAELSKKLSIEGLKKRLRESSSFRENLKEVYETHRANEQYYARAEEDLRRLNRSAIEPLTDALRLLRTYDELEPDWEEDARHVRKSLRHTQVGAQLLVDDPSLGSTEEMKEALIREIEEMKLNSGMKVLILNLSAKGESLPDWEEAREQLGLPPLPSGTAIERLLPAVKQVLEKMKTALDKQGDLSTFTLYKTDGADILSLSDLSMKEVMRKSVEEREELNLEAAERAYYRYIDNYEDVTGNRPEDPEELLELLRRLDEASE